MKYEHLSSCVGKTLTRVIDPLGMESLVLVFGDAWTVIEADADDDEGYIDLPSFRDPSRLASGYDKTELQEAGVIDQTALEKIKEAKKRRLESEIAEAEQHLKNLQLRAETEGMT